MFNLAESYYCAETLAAELLFSRSEFVVQFHFSSSLVSTPSVHAQIWSRPDMTFAVDGVKQQLSIQVWNCPRVAERDNVVQNFRVTSRLTNLVRLSWSPPKKPGVNVYLVSLTSDFVCLFVETRPVACEASLWCIHFHSYFSVVRNKFEQDILVFLYYISIECFPGQRFYFAVDAITSSHL